MAGLLLKEGWARISVFLRASVYVMLTNPVFVYKLRKRDTWVSDYREPEHTFFDLNSEEEFSKKQADGTIYAPFDINYPDDQDEKRHTWEKNLCWVKAATQASRPVYVYSGISENTLLREGKCLAKNLNEEKKLGNFSAFTREISAFEKAGYSLGFFEENGLMLRLLPPEVPREEDHEEGINPTYENCVATITHLADTILRKLQTIAGDESFSEWLPAETREEYFYNCSESSDASDNLQEGKMNWSDFDNFFSELDSIYTLEEIKLTRKMEVISHLVEKKIIMTAENGKFDPNLSPGNAEEHDLAIEGQDLVISYPIATASTPSFCP